MHDFKKAVCRVSPLNFYQQRGRENPGVGAKAADMQRQQEPERNMATRLETINSVEILRQSRSRRQLQHMYGWPRAQQHQGYA